MFQAEKASSLSAKLPDGVRIPHPTSAILKTHSFSSATCFIFIFVLLHRLFPFCNEIVTYFPAKITNLSCLLPVLPFLHTILKSLGREDFASSISTLLSYCRRTSQSRVRASPRKEVSCPAAFSCLRLHSSVLSSFLRVITGLWRKPAN